MEEIFPKKFHEERPSFNSLYEEAMARVQRITDSIGYPVDEDIKSAVAVMWVYGLETTGSCAGHKGERNTMPYIEFNGPYEFPNAFASDTEELAKWHAIQRKVLSDKLEEFYKDREASKGHLKLENQGIYGGFRLTCKGSRKSLKKEQETLEADLAAYQKEFADFVLFLASSFDPKNPQLEPNINS